MSAVSLQVQAWEIDLSTSCHSCEYRLDCGQAVGKAKQVRLGKAAAAGHGPSIVSHLPLLPSCSTSPNAGAQQAPFLAGLVHTALLTT